MAPFDRAYRFTMGWEAGSAAKGLLDHGATMDRRALVDDPVDRGGRTAYGVTQATFDKWCAAQHLPPRDVWTVTAAEIRAIAYDRYWLPCAGFCPERLAIAVFDTCFLHGKGYAIPRLQIALGLKGDGLVGPITRAALDACRDLPERESEVLRAFLQARDDRYEQLVGRDGSQVKWYAGWEKRLDALEDLLGVPRTVDPPMAA